MTLPFENDTSRVINKIVSVQLKHDKLKKSAYCCCYCIGCVFDDDCIASGIRDY